MYDILKAASVVNDWVFTYARHDFANLYDELDEGKINLFLDPVVIDDIMNDMNETEAKTYSGSFMFVLSSDLDEKTYEDRYEEYIKPLLEEKIAIVKDEISCNNEATFNQWRTIEVINALDYNFDGLIIQYNITIDV